MSTDPLMTAILEELSRGRIDAAEAARRIDALKASPAPAPEPAEPPAATPVAEPTAAAPAAQPTPDEPSGTRSADPWAAATDRPQQATYTRESVRPPERAKPRPATGGVERISIRVVGRRVRVVGEPSVATLSADGPHVLRRNGSVLEVTSDGEIGPSLDGFSILRGVPRSLDDIRALGLGKELVLRVNPDIAVDAEVTAGNLHTEGVPRLGKVRVTAGGAKLLEVSEVHDVLVQAGSATITGTIRQGRHRLRAESGSLSVALADGSDVTVHSDAQLGRVSWSGGHSGAGDEVVMGHGNARLDVEVVMGHAQVRVGTDAGAPAGSGAS